MENTFTSGQKERYWTFDFLKFVCAFFVVCIHIKFPGAVGNAFQSTICRIAVPIFFMITGFFYSRTCEKGKQLKQIKRVLLLFFTSCVFFFIVHILVSS